MICIVVIRAFKYRIYPNKEQKVLLEKHFGCGYINHSLTLKDREWTCPMCKVTHDRDILAANNIKKLGLGQPEAASGQLKKSWMKEETHLL